jgi:hypothetical protein
MLKATEKTFRRGIIPQGQPLPAITSPTHALLHLHDGQVFTVFMAGVLAAPIRVVEQTRFWLPAPLCPVGKNAICRALTHNEVRM